MLTVTFHADAEVDDSLLKFAVIAARYQGNWVLCRHKARSTWEIPGGHREEGEPIDETARRELWEETGAVEFALHPVCVYNVVRDGASSYGKLYYADIAEFGTRPEESEIGEVKPFLVLPGGLTYPEIQPHLYLRVLHWLKARDFIDTRLGKCGFFCGGCPTYLEGNCAGCVDAHKLGDCFTRDCVLRQDIPVCTMCKDFPCDTILEKDHCTVLDKDWLRWKKSEKT